jgi:S-adenosylmethionine uptake transporter
MNPATPRYAPFVAAAMGVALFSVMDAVMKRASIASGAYNALYFRSLIGSVLAVATWRAMGGGRLPGRAALRLHALRSAVVSIMALLFFWGLVRVPMAEAIALSFIAPLIALYLAALVLGETIERRAIAASLLGVAGVVVIAAQRFSGPRPDADTLLGIAAVLGSAVLYAWNLILQRQQALLAAPAEVAAFQNVFVALFLSLAAPWLAVVPAAAAFVDISAGAVMSITALMLLSWSYARAETQALVPIEYSAFVWAALVGWAMFGEALTLATLAGAALIVLGCWIAARTPTEQTALG